MHKDMRRKDRQLTEEEARAVLEKCRYGILSTVSAEGEPYGVPLSYAVMNGAVYFHCGLTGEKLDNIAAEPRVSFTVVGDTEPVYVPGYSTYYESCILFGTAREVTDAEEKRAALRVRVDRYLPEYGEHFEEEIKKEKVTRVFVIEAARISGKAKKKIS